MKADDIACIADILAGAALWFGMLLVIGGVLEHAGVALLGGALFGIGYMWVTK